ncbi:hypothetical protein WOLCODRAFT_16274 [Wolfiporia cocos MD-104 SS10]|uniref:Uncharacterized protein n=1 Tax=Wolfiporia cocos (strain MD-104) TaxID=742152 RepID=A0A2H3JCX1_WOLCO|nr:hypothetical protein WOLCODRAFT_16274 [Wolfiporia cocos MD-104 SS10]
MLPNLGISEDAILPVEAGSDVTPLFKNPCGITQTPGRATVGFIAPPFREFLPGSSASEAESIDSEWGIRAFGHKQTHCGVTERRSWGGFLRFNHWAVAGQGSTPLLAREVKILHQWVITKSDVYPLKLLPHGRYSYRPVAMTWESLYSLVLSVLPFGEGRPYGRTGALFPPRLASTALRASCKGPCNGDQYPPPPLMWEDIDDDYIGDLYAPRTRPHRGKTRVMSVPPIDTASGSGPWLMHIGGRVANEKNLGGWMYGQLTIAQQLYKLDAEGNSSLADWLAGMVQALEGVKLGLLNTLDTIDELTSPHTGAVVATINKLYHHTHHILDHFPDQECPTPATAASAPTPANPLSEALASLKQISEHLDAIEAGPQKWSDTHPIPTHDDPTASTSGRRQGGNAPKHSYAAVTTKAPKTPATGTNAQPVGVPQPSPTAPDTNSTATPKAATCTHQRWVVRFGRRSPDIIHGKHPRILCLELTRALTTVPTAKQVQVLGIEHTSIGNLIITFTPDSPHSRIEHHIGVVHTALDLPEYAVIGPDSPWTKVVLHRVATWAHPGAPLFDSDTLLTELKRNPHLAKLTITQPPRWISIPDTLHDKSFSSISVAVEDLDLKHCPTLLKSTTFMFGSTVTFSPPLS